MSRHRSASQRVSESASQRQPICGRFLELLISWGYVDTNRVRLDFGRVAPVSVIRRANLDEGATGPSRLGTGDDGTTMGFYGSSDTWMTPVKSY